MWMETVLGHGAEGWPSAWCGLRVLSRVRERNVGTTVTAILLWAEMDGSGLSVLR